MSHKICCVDISFDMLCFGCVHHITFLQKSKQKKEKMIFEILEKKNYVDEQADMKTRQKMYAFLLRKGFSSEKIRKVMNAEGYF